MRLRERLLGDLRGIEGTQKWSGDIEGNDDLACFNSLMFWIRQRNGAWWVCGFAEGKVESSVNCKIVL